MSALRQMYVESLSTHSKLSKNDIVWASKVLEEIEASQSVKSMIVIMMNRLTNTGLHARMFNITVDNIILTREHDRFNKLLSLDFKKLYPEIYDNPRIDDEDKKKIVSVVNMEHNTTLIIINDWKSNKTNLMPHNLHKMPEGYIKGEKPIYIETYNILCMKDDVYSSEYTNKRDIKARDARDGKLYTFDKIQIAVRFSEGIYTDPVTGEPLPKGIVNFIKKRLDIDIKLFSRPLDIQELPALGPVEVKKEAKRSIKPLMSPSIYNTNTSLPTLKEGRLMSPRTSTEPMTFETKIKTPIPEIKSPYAKMEISSPSAQLPELSSPSVPTLSSTLSSLPSSTLSSIPTLSSTLSSVPTLSSTLSSVPSSTLSSVPTLSSTLSSVPSSTLSSLSSSSVSSIPTLSSTLSSLPSSSLPSSSLPSSSLPSSSLPSSSISSVPSLSSLPSSSISSVPSLSSLPSSSISSVPSLSSTLSSVPSLSSTLSSVPSLSSLPSSSISSVPTLSSSISSLPPSLPARLSTNIMSMPPAFNK